MDNINENKRKPRRTRGTPAYKYRNKFALAWIAVGSLIFAGLTFTPGFQKLNKDIWEKLEERNEEEIDKRYLFKLPKPITSRGIEAEVEAEKDLRAER